VNRSVISISQLKSLPLKRLRLAPLILVILCVICGCDKGNRLPDVPHRVINVDDEDEAMNAAIETAKETFPQFERNWKRNDIEGFSIKLAMKTDDGDLEHIWFTPIEIGAEQLTATCANDPENVTGLQHGDVRAVDRSAVSDWMIMENGKCYGGYTIRVLSERDPDVAPPLEFGDYPKDAK